MDLEPRLRAFGAVARRRSFSGAAADLAISQPAISKHVADLERKLDLQLVQRGQQGSTLTPAGEFLANHILRAEAILAQAIRGVAEFRHPGAGTLSIVASGIPGTYLLPEVIGVFHLAHPNVRIALELQTSASAVEWLRVHRAELGVVGGFAAAPEIEAEALVEDTIILVGPRQLEGRRMSRRELESLTWISREKGSASRAAVEAAWRDLGFVPTRRLELPSWEAVKLAVIQGAGIAACSRFAVESELHRGAVVLIRFRPWNVRRTISIIRVRDASLTPSATEFLTMLRARWGQQSAHRAQVTGA
jgi:LysR family transcriptional regulator, transcriptional activator of the cysJI operon